MIPDAACIKKIPATWTLKSVRIGEWNLATEIDCDSDDPDFCAPLPIDINVVQIITHKDYKHASKEQHNDIALVRLAKKVRLNEFVQPICLPLDTAIWNKDFSSYTLETAGEKWKFI